MTRGMDWSAIVTSITAFAVYYNTWDSGFVYDDNRAILSNEDVLPQTPVLELLRHDFWGTPLSHSGSHGSYRPLVVLSFRLNVLLAGGHSARGFHVLNTLLHAAATAAFTRWVRVLAAHPRRDLTPWVAGMLFAVHPIHTEAVAGIVGRADVGAALFFVLALLAYHRHVARRDALSLGATLLLGLCAMFTKEQGVTVFAVCVVYDLALHPTTLRRTCRKMPRTHEEARATRSLVTLVVSAIFLLGLRTWLTGGNVPTFAAADNPASRSDSFFTRALTFFYLPAFNFGLLLCPSTLSFDWSMDAIPLISNILDVRNLASFIFYSALFFSIHKHVIYLYTNSKRLKPEQVAKDTSSVDVNFNSQNVICKHFIANTQSYRSDLNIVSVFNHILDTIYSWIPRLHTVSSSKSLCFPLKSFNCNNYSSQCQCTIKQKSPAKLRSVSVSDCVRRQDSVVLVLSVAVMVISFLPATNLVAYVGFVVAERVLYIPSLGFCLLIGHGFVKILDRFSEKNSSRKWNTILLMIVLCLILIVMSGRTIVRNGDWKNEETLYRSGIAVNPAKAYGNLGNILSVKGQHEEAEACYRKALQYRPNMADAHYNLGVLLQSRQRYSEAMLRYRVAIQCRPRLAVAHLNLGLVLGRVGRVDEAKSVLRGCAGLDGSGLRDPRTHYAARVACLFHLGRLAMEQGQLQEAVDVFLEAVRKRPHYYAPQSLFNMLGEAYSRLGRDADAEPWFRASLSTRPDHVPAHLTYGKLLARNRTRVREAEEWYVRAERLAPGDASVFRHYGQFLLSQKRYAEAAVKLEHAVALSATPEFEDVVSTATSLRLAGDFKGAENYYKLAISLRPQEASSIANLGALYHLTGRLDEAEIRYQEALNLLPGDDVTRANLKRLRNLKNIQLEKQRLRRT
ncbi:protein O-mannosyl-transferase TMTC2-like [Periplaneta americana]|uniref:protein O-mannosyl-transferase TMTC2-like n=1 Tax=Periplaneta americana TaxID=6978 RepID=UPI0037E6FB95